MTTAPPAVPPPAATHPEEMRATVELQVGGLSLRASARATPAGLLAAGALAAAVLVPAIWIVRGWRAGPRGGNRS